MPPNPFRQRPVRNSLRPVCLSQENEDALHALSSPYWEGRLCKKKPRHGRFEDPYKDKFFCWLSSDGVLYLYPVASAATLPPSGELVVQGVGLERYSLADYSIVEEKESAKFNLFRGSSILRFKADRQAECDECVSKLLDKRRHVRGQHLTRRALARIWTREKVRAYTSIHTCMHACMHACIHI